MVLLSEGLELSTYGESIANQSALPLLMLSAATLPVLGPVSATSILSSSFGYTMRIAAPLSILNFLNIASNKGILIKDGRALEELVHVDTAQIILMNRDLTQLLELFDLAKNLQKNMDTNLFTTIYPGTISIGGVFLFHFGVITTEFIFYLSLISGVFNASLPQFQYGDSGRTKLKEIGLDERRT